jgi:cysteine desulfuration protein SufE
MNGAEHGVRPDLRSKLEERVAALLRLRNPQQRLAVLVEAARRRPALPEALRTEANRVQGCLVRAWFVAEVRDGRCFFQSDSDAVTLKALLGLLCDEFSGHTPEEIAACEGPFLARLGVLPQIAENRQRTVLRVEQQLHEFARHQLAAGREFPESQFPH